MSTSDTTGQREEDEKPTSKASQTWSFLSHSFALIIQYLFRFVSSTFGLDTIRNQRLNRGPNDPTLQICYEEKERLAKIWATEDKFTILFVALEIGFQPEDPKRICDIGLSIWCPSGAVGTRSYHRIIKSNNNLDDETIGESDDLVEGNNGFIQEFEIGEFLNKTFRAATSSYSNVCLAGYGIRKTTKALYPYWQASAGVQLIDIQMILRARYKDQESIIFEERVSMIAGPAHKVGSYNAARSKAFASIAIIQNGLGSTF